MESLRADIVTSAFQLDFVVDGAETWLSHTTLLVICECTIKKRFACIFTSSSPLLLFTSAKAHMGSLEAM